MTDEDYCANLYELETRFLKTEESLGLAESTQEYTEAIDSILGFINERAKYRVADLPNFKLCKPWRETQGLICRSWKWLSIM